MDCKNCGKKLKEGKTFCKECGFENEIKENEQNETSNDEIKNKRLSETWKILGIVILAVMIIVGIYMGDKYKVNELVYESSVGLEYNQYDEVFNIMLMLYYWAAGIVTCIFCQAINSICYRLDLLINKN